MLSLQQAIEIKESIVSYLKATFMFRKKEVAQAFDEFLNHPTKGMFKGPFLSLKLPFVKATDNDIAKIPLQIKPDWRPYDHQIKSWQRLSTQSQNPLSTIVTTGTGSGKTEAFLYPILDYCFQQLHRPGIKVIILYPMNALATDQAKRLAEAIYEDERLKGVVTAGLFIGEGTAKNISLPKTMGSDHIIEDRNSILDTSPDILLTNFKMLDYALMKHNYHQLWVYNLNDPDLLRFLVLDELHTYDGAQGTDVANLIRRLKLKLQLPQGQICAVGTSATIGSGEEAPALLADYATKVFGEKITEDAIITENRIDVNSFFDSGEDLKSFLPEIPILSHLIFQGDKSLEEFIDENIRIWEVRKESLSGDLIHYEIVKDLFRVCAEKGIQDLKTTIRDLSQINEEFRKVPEWDENEKFNPKQTLLESLIILISVAKEIGNDRLPFMYLQTQLWIRELAGIQYTLETVPRFTFREQVERKEKLKEEVAALPPWYCRECNSSGWLGVKLENKDHFSTDINEVYNKFFDHHKNLYFILPEAELNEEDLEVSGYKPDDFLRGKLNPTTLKFVNVTEEGMGFQAFRKLRENRSEHICPCCNSTNTVAIIGTKIPTLSSIAVSQTLATDLDLAEEKNRKILAFTNSVQDAAHQAGFVEARNYRFTFRSSVQKTINLVYTPMRLPELYKEFKTYWKEWSDPTKTDKQGGYFYRFYPKDYKGKSSPENYRQGDGYTSHFVEEFDKRVEWELYSEFGFRSLLGRTLEKTGTSAVSFDKECLENAWQTIQAWILENDVSNTMNKESWIRFTTLVLHRSRSRGAVAHEYLNKFREGRYKLWDLNWMKDTRHFLNPTYGGKARLPKLLTNGNHFSGLLDTTNARTTNWFHAYFIKSFPQASNLKDFINDFYEEWLNALNFSGILDKVMGDLQDTFAINPEVIWVQKEVKNFECDTCSHVVYCHDENERIEKGACLTYRCIGHYKEMETPVPNYYRAVYNRKRSPRIYAAEHTGLLTREVRENLEIEYKNRPNFNSPNTLVATSTLEMGIDIGSLNTAYNNSVPPLPSNFLQRVGRAGRSSGDALIINFAKHQNHDLFYFTDPQQMMEGDVNTPGCYLEAKDILRRHFTAFCFDSWTSDNPEENAIPNIVKSLKLESRNLTEEDFFINKINSFIEKNKVQLCNDFLKHYDENIRTDTFKEIKESLDNGFFYKNLSSVFERVKQELIEIKNLRKELDKEQKKLNLSTDDPKYIEFDNGKRNLSGIRRSIFARNITEHLTNIGILPNYAFPETGVTLNAQVLRSKAIGETSHQQDKEFELVRSASQAIKEFAPENYFYTQGYKFKISGVNTFEWSDKENYHQKRFCSRCDHLENADLTQEKNCPKCGDPSWGSASNIHDFVKLTYVRSVNSEGKASLSDDNDDREFLNYQLINHIKIDKKTSQGAYILKDIPFGIEYVKSASLSTVNYGKNEVNDARRLKINDSEVMTKGFVTCRYCGKSSSSIHEKNYKFHYGYCKHRDTEYKNESNDIFKEIYFFRSFKTEILKIVLPIQSFNTEADITMFKAGIELGLRRYFKGNPEHLHILTYKEYNQKTDKFDRFLILYDTIPGGTGYLQQLFDTKEFTELLKLSYTSIKECECQYEGKDGCYKCVFSYGNQYNRSDLSRKKAEEWFEEILAKAENWEERPEGLTAITNSGKIEESELEERFIKYFKLFAEKTEGYQFETINVDGVSNYYLSIEVAGVKAAYWIIPQYSLGPKDNIAYSTRADFLIKCETYKTEGIEFKNQIKSIAIYVDGFQFHASEENNVFEKDIKIRQAIAKSQEFKTWSLTWKDMDLMEAFLNDEICSDELNNNFKQNFKAHYVSKLLKSIRQGKIVDYSIPSSSSLRLIQQLEAPVISLTEKSWYSYLGSWTNSFLNPSYKPTDLSKLIKNEDPLEDNYLISNRIADLDGLLPVEHLPVFDFAHWRVWVNIGKKEIYNSVELKDTTQIDRTQWELFWLYFNIFQSADFIEEPVQNEFEQSLSSSRSDEDDLFDELKKFYDVELHAILKQAIDRSLISVENIDMLNSLLDDNGDIIAEAEFVFEEIKIAVLPFTLEDENRFRKENFQVYNKDELKNLEL